MFDSKMPPEIIVEPNRMAIPTSIFKSSKNFVDTISIP